MRVDQFSPCCSKCFGERERERDAERGRKGLEWGETGEGRNSGVCAMNYVQFSHSFRRAAGRRRRTRRARPGQHRSQAAAVRAADSSNNTKRRRKHRSRYSETF